ncbi:MAG: hypothetical protein AAB839_00085 [Patescibacteria group bacterium]
MKFSLKALIRRMEGGNEKRVPTTPISRQQLKKEAERVATKYGGVIKELSRE